MVALPNLSLLNSDSWLSLCFGWWWSQEPCNQELGGGQETKRWHMGQGGLPQILPTQAKPAPCQAPTGGGWPTPWCCCLFLQAADLPVYNSQQAQPHWHSCWGKARREQGAWASCVVCWDVLTLLLAPLQRLLSKVVPSELHLWPPAQPCPTSRLPQEGRKEEEDIL